MGHVVRNLIIANVGVFLTQMLLDRGSGSWAMTFGLVPADFWHGHLWQVVTYMFLHSQTSFFHLFFNMFALWMFGRTLEAYWGSRQFAIYYFVCGIGAGLSNALVTPTSPIPIVGASGAVFGLLLAFGMTFPNQMIMLLFPPIPMKAKYFVMIFGAIELFMAFSGSNRGVAHFAHLGGMLFGYLYLKKDMWLFKVRRWNDARETQKNMKVVWDRKKEKEKLQKEIDDLLDKINKVGLDKLSPAEIKRLKQASAQLKEWEKSN